MLFGSAPLTGVRVVSAVGSGGKTSLLAALARELPGRVVLCTTTHILPFAGVPLVCGGAGEVERALAESRVVCVGVPVEGGAGGAGAAGAGTAAAGGAGASIGKLGAPAVGAGKLGAPAAGAGKLGAPAVGIDVLAELADHVLVEADGSRRLPLKAHASWEPVVPACSEACVLVVGARGLGQPIERVVHRPGLFCSRAGCWEDDLASPARVAQVIASERADGLLSFDHLLVNQVRDDRSRQAGLALVRELGARGIDVPAELANLPRP